MPVPAGAGVGAIVVAWCIVCLVQRGWQRRRRLLVHSSVARGARDRWPCPDGRHGSLPGLAPGNSLARRRAPRRGGAGTARLLRPRNIKCTLAGSRVRLGARVAVGARPLVGPGRLGSLSSLGGGLGAGLGMDRRGAAILICQGGVPAQAGRCVRATWRASAGGSGVLADEAACLAQRFLSVEGASLLGNQLTAVLLRQGSGAQGATWISLVVAVRGSREYGCR